MTLEAERSQQNKKTVKNTRQKWNEENKNMRMKRNSTDGIFFCEGFTVPVDIKH